MRAQGRWRKGMIDGTSAGALHPYNVFGARRLMPRCRQRWGASGNGVAAGTGKLAQRCRPGWREAGRRGPADMGGQLWRRVVCRSRARRAGDWRCRCCIWSCARGGEHGRLERKSRWPGRGVVVSSLRPRISVRPPCTASGARFACCRAWPPIAAIQPGP